MCCKTGLIPICSNNHCCFNMTGCSQDKCFQYSLLSQSYTLSEALSENTHNFLRTALGLLRVVEEQALIIMYQSATAGDETMYGGPRASVAAPLLTSDPGRYWGLWWFGARRGCAEAARVLIRSHSSFRQSTGPAKHWGKIFCLPQQTVINCPFIDVEDKFFLFLSHTHSHTYTLTFFSTPRGENLVLFFWATRQVRNGTQSCSVSGGNVCVRIRVQRGSHGESLG